MTFTPVPTPGVCVLRSVEMMACLSSPQTRVLVTHSINFLPQMDFITVLADGQVSEAGPYPALLQHSGSFANFLCNYAPDKPEKNMKEGSRTGNHP